MGVRRWLLALLLLWLALGSASGGPLSEATDGKEPMEGHTLNLVHPKEVRSVGGHRHSGWRRYRRPRPRLSHKGPMPF
ncbi:apelin [Liasis olivaceus]